MLYVFDDIFYVIVVPVIHILRFVVKKTKICLVYVVSLFGVEIVQPSQYFSIVFIIGVL